MARRSSARLRGRNSTTPKRVSLSHEVAAPRTVPAKLASLQESDEMPGAFPQSPTGTPTRPTKRVARGSDATPKAAAPIRPDEAEMHPQLFHQTTSKPLDEARYLGFSSLAPRTEPPKQTSRIAMTHATPTRAQNPSEDVTSPSYQFTFRREHSLELSPEAKRLMNEKREEAARIREQMIASGEAKQTAEMAARKIATPTGRSRYSEAHSAAFQKMESIAGHASAFRADPNRIKTPNKAADSPQVTTAAKSLKRSPSKAQLDATASAQRQLHRSPSKPNLVAAAHAVARKPELAEPSSPAKRIKRAAEEDVSATRQSSTEDKRAPSTPQQNKSLHTQPSYPDLSKLATPTQASLARATSIKSVKTSKIPGPALARSPSKHNLHEAFKAGEVAATPQVPRSIMKPITTHAEAGPSTPLLARSPSKPTLFPEIKNQRAVEEGRDSPLLARSPLKASVMKKPTESEEEVRSKSPEAPLLARSPLKKSVAKSSDVEMKDEQHQPTVPLLARSPSKIALPTDNNAPRTPGKSFAAGLKDRFNLLRASPKKSILRTPQRLYSDDPAKIAAGTHLATPPKKTQAGSKTPQSRLPGPTDSARKRVDFTSSTKARHEASEALSSSASPSPAKIAVRAATPEAVSTTPTHEPESPQVSFGYPDLAPDTRLASPSPQKRRQSIAPGDFTFRVNDHGIVFAASPNAPPSAAKLKRASTIRHVSASSAETDPCAETDPNAAAAAAVPPPTIQVQGSKKRKFEFENEFAIHPPTGAVEDKENLNTATDAAEEEEHRPAKRAKANPAEKEPIPSPTKPAAAPATRLPTLGVKPKGVKTAVGGAGKDGKGKPSGGRPSTISQARLNALAMPKKRG
jgi:hypothetical protein